MAEVIDLDRFAVREHVRSVATTTQCASHKGVSRGFAAPIP